MKLISSLLRFFFKLLYHQFAWGYDLVAAVVSLGAWKTWVYTVVPYMKGRTLEIGSGPGHLQAALHKEGYRVFGFDESRQMLHLTRRNMIKKGYIPSLARGLAQNLPYANGSFDTVIATFPSEYIFDPDSLAGIRRLLTPSGKLVILPFAWITGTKPMEKLAAWLFRVTGEAPDIPGQISKKVIDLISDAGFSVKQEMVSHQDSKVLLLIAGRQPPQEVEANPFAVK